MLRLSLLTACYNSANTIGNTLRSVNVQDYQEIEHIIIDGGSHDNTIEICKATGTRISKIISEPDDGIYYAYNKGLRLATGDIIGFINSDDYYATPNVASRVMQAFNDPTIDAVYADLVYVHPSKTHIVQRHWQSMPMTKKALKNGFIPAHPTLFLRRHVYDKVGDFNTEYSLAADYEFMLRAFFKHAVTSIYIPEIWVRMRSGGATSKNYKSILLQNKEIRQAQKKHQIQCSTWSFYALKTADRLLQRARAQFIDAPDLFLSRIS